mmetsp:Transcript_90681/g.161461  ORF Transcript_90681/g.161461 Transcript_90681/m.161461 type:complete len:89 (+) Transcript_90681:3-269(+)
MRASTMGTVPRVLPVDEDHALLEVLAVEMLAVGKRPLVSEAPPMTLPLADTTCCSTSWLQELCCALRSEASRAPFEATTVSDPRVEVL